jgi:hypothetical protein
MSMAGVLRKEIESAYRLKLAEIRRADEADVLACLNQMRGGPRSGLAVVRAAGGKLVDDAVSRCEAAMVELIIAHLDAGDRSRANIVEDVRSKFLEPALAVLPGAGLYASTRGDAVPAMRTRQDMEARFSSRKGALLQSVEDHVIRKLATYRGDTRLQKLKRWAEENPVLVFIIVGLAALSALNRTVWDLARWLKHLVKL